MGMRFCTECGSPLALACPACGAAIAGTEKFCGQCGSPLGERAAEANGGAVLAPREAPPAASAERRDVAGVVAERRFVSVLFADLVGFTAASERRDAEDTREFLAAYFELCRRLIELYGGSVEKFIGDAVVGLWGAPVATEDDPERAVRAALELVAAVQALGEKAGDPELRARAGVLSGEAAVTLGASVEAMIAGDLVNTASRVQSVAPPAASWWARGRGARPSRRWSTSRLAISS